MSNIYIYDGYFEKGDKGWPMIREAASRHGLELGLAYDFHDGEILRTEKGKPFFVDSPVEFSLTHSGEMWMCMFGSKPCGLDLQIVKDCQFEKLAERWYTPAERHYVELWGLEGFFDIWVRKEAFGKCTGLGIFSKMPSMVDDQADLASVIEYDGLAYYMKAIEISPEMKCAACMTEKDEIELRILG